MINYTVKAMLQQHAVTFKLPTRQMSNPIQVEKRKVLWTACSGNNTSTSNVFSVFMLKRYARMYGNI